jgi:hypothetical protein
MWLAWVPMLLIPVAVQWWAVWYPGAEPGGGGYIAQRMLAAKDEKNAIGATLGFNFMHYAMRPWPWIIVALASILCYPTLESIHAQFPNIDPNYLKQDIAYPAMIARLGPGLLGLVVASLIAAYMSTIGTHLNWGSSYAVNDFYARFIRKNASQKELVTVGRIMTVVLMIIAGVIALKFLQNAGQAFKFLLLSGAGTGAIYLLRWFWYRINAWTEIAAMVAASVVAIWIIAGPGDEGVKSWIVDYRSVQEFVQTVDDPAVVASVEAGGDVLETLATANPDIAAFLIENGAPREVETMVKGGKLYIYDARVAGLVFPVQLLICVGFVTLAWLGTTLLTKPAETSTLRSFYKLCHPGGPGWKRVVLDARADGEEIDQKDGITDWNLPVQLLCVFLGCVAIYSSLFAVGNFIYGNMLAGISMSVLAAGTMVVLFRSFGKLGAE